MARRFWSCLVRATQHHHMVGWCSTFMGRHIRPLCQRRPGMQMNSSSGGAARGNSWAAANAIGCYRPLGCQPLDQGPEQHHMVIAQVKTVSETRCGEVFLPPPHVVGWVRSLHHDLLSNSQPCIVLL